MFIQTTITQPKRTYREYLHNIQFRLIHPQTPFLPIGFDRFSQRLNLGQKLEFLNTLLPQVRNSTKTKLQKLCRVPRMSTYAMGAIINETVCRMPRNTTFVNVGVWHGFTFLSGIIDNAEKHCIGIDNFSEYGGPKDQFYERFEAHQSPHHDFYEMDYRRYFDEIHREPIGFYIYDGNHSYENQFQALKIAEPYFADNCVILVDDTNYEQVRQANQDFIQQSSHRYELLFDQQTFCNHHPTFWNGVTIFRKVR